MLLVAVQSCCAAVCTDGRIDLTDFNTWALYLPISHININIYIYVSHERFYRSQYKYYMWWHHKFVTLWNGGKVLHILVYFSFGFCIVLRVKTMSVVGGYARLLELGLDWRRRIYSILTAKLRFLYVYGNTVCSYLQLHLFFRLKCGRQIGCPLYIRVSLIVFFL